MKKILLVTISIVILSIILRFVFIPSTSAVTVTKTGQWIYDKNGDHEGCKSPGKDCTWQEEDLS